MWCVCVCVYVCVCVCVSVLHIHILLRSSSCLNVSLFRIQISFWVGKQTRSSHHRPILLCLYFTTEFSNYIVRNIISYAQHYSIGKIMRFSSNYLPAVGKLGLVLCGAPGSLLSAGKRVTDSSSLAMSSRSAIPSLAFTSRNCFYIACIRTFRIRL